MSARGRGNLYEDYSKIVQRFVGAADRESVSKDALEYLHEVLGKMAGVSAMLASSAPVAPEMAVLTDDDIIGPIEWHR